MINLDNMTLHQLIEIGFRNLASDVFVKANQQPTMKQHSILKPLEEGLPVVTPEAAQRMITEVMSPRQLRIFEETMEMDLAFAVGDYCRIRANIYMQRGTWAIVCRIIPLNIRSLEELGLPPVLSEL